MLNLWNEGIGLPEVGRGGEAADPGEFVDVVNAEIEALAAAHGQTGDRAVVPVCLHGVVRFNVGHQILQQVLLKEGVVIEIRHEIARRGFGSGAAVGHYDDHGHGFFVGDEVVEDLVGRAEARPMSLVAADAVHQVEDRVFLISIIIGRGVDDRFAVDADALGVVRNGLQLAFRDVRPDLDEVGRRVIGQCQRQRPPSPARRPVQSAAVPIAVCTNAAPSRQLTRNPQRSLFERFMENLRQ